MPFQCNDNYNTYVENLAILNNIIGEAGTHHIAIIGDMNANTSSMFGNELIDFCERCELIISDITFS